jgi:transposase, IS30 family
MGQSYNHLSLEGRCTIARLQAEGHSIRQIAAAVDRSPSTISRELRRNRAKKAYKPGYAEEQSKARRWSGSRLERHAALREAVLSGLRHGLSPEQIAGRLARENGGAVISHETIYRFIYAQIRRTNDFSWRRYLPRAKAKRGFRGKKGGSPASFIQGRISVAERPLSASDREDPGHWEADLMMFAKYGQAILTLHERTSRLILARRPVNKTADLVAATLADILALLPEPMRQTITFDNGTEFARHSELHQLNLQTFFCAPHSPWQKGGIENAIGRMRRSLPRKTDLATITTPHFNQLVRAYNNTPRKCLDFQTPAEVFMSQVLHFKCESTSRLSPG